MGDEMRPETIRLIRFDVPQNVFEYLQFLIEKKGYDRRRLRSIGFSKYLIILNQTMWRIKWEHILIQRT